MSENIVSREILKSVIGREKEALRMMIDDGLEFDDLQRIQDNPEGRKRLVAYIQAGMPEVGLWKIWKTIKCDSAHNFHGALNEKGFHVSDWAKDTMSKPDFKKSLKLEQECNLVLLTTSQLTGKKSNATTQEVFNGAERLGLQKCPAWVGPQLRLDYEDQPNAEWIRIGMEPITGSGGGPDVFSVDRNDSELWLSALHAHAGRLWDPVYLWAFCPPRK